MEAARPERCALLRFLLLLLLLLLFGFSSTSSAWDLVLLHTNDVHARVEETSRDSGKCSNSSRGCFAGAARRATAVERVRRAESNVLLLDAGDQFQGTAWFNVYKGEEAARFMNKLHYDAMVFGNHEFDNGVDGLMSPFMQQIQFPIVCSNIKVDQTLAATFGTSFLPYKVFTVDGEKVAVVGYTSQETPALSRPGPHLDFLDEVESLQLQVNKLQTLGINKIIALGHSGFTVDQKIAKKVRGVDVVIGGHSNTFLYTGPAPSSEVPAGPYPVLVQSEDGRQVPVVQAYAFGKYLGFLKVTFDAAGNVQKAEGNPILLDSSVPQDPDVLAEVKSMKLKLANYSAQTVGKTLVYLNGTAEECRFRECNLGNLICDAMIDNYVRFSDGPEWNLVSACILNGGGIRTSIDEQSRDGAITMEDLISVLPFGGTFDLVQLKGSSLLKAFEFSVRRYGQSTGEFLQVSGFQVEFDLSQPEGRRVRRLSVLCTDCRVPKYKAVQPEARYTVVLPSYLVKGGDGFSMIKTEMLKHSSGDLDITVVSKYIQQQQKVYPSVEGRIRFLNASGRVAPSLLCLGLLLTLCGLL